jgi:hypothetical protein
MLTLFTTDANRDEVLLLVAQGASRRAGSPVVCVRFRSTRALDPTIRQRRRSPCRSSC